MATRRRPPLVDDFDDIDIDDGALECLGDTSLSSFSASPARLAPFAGPATLRWSASVPVGCRVGFRINGRSVSRSGSLEVLPAVDTSYTLSAHVGPASRVLGRVTVAVDTDACSRVELAESILRGQLEQTVGEFAASSDRAYDAKLTRFDITPSGITVSIRTKLEINNFSDPTLYVDFVLGLDVVDGSVVPRYKSFNVDVDWPWWVTTLTLGITKIVEEFIESDIESGLKDAIRQRITDKIDAMVDLLGDDKKVHTVSLTDESVVVTACPQGKKVPDVSLPVFTGPLVVRA